MAERSAMRRRLRRWLGYPPEAVAVVIAFAVFGLLPVDAASALGGRLGRAIGPLLPATRRAARRIERTLPDLSPDRVRAVVAAMCDNLGRVLAEYPHIERIARNRVEIAGAEHIAALRERGGACILFSGHFGNWEVFALTAREIGIPYAQIYRAANNPLVDRLLRRLRRLEADDIVPKGPTGARKAIEVLRAGRRLGMLVDQKMNDGVEVPFFGRPAMTAPALAQFALRFACPVVPARLERTGGCRFRLTFYAPLRPTPSGDRQGDVRETMTRVNALLEGWIRDRPEQWLWLHRRWPED